jgi:hypothetical protein
VAHNLPIRLPEHGGGSLDEFPPEAHPKRQLARIIE